jgi:undecaprenyl-diphosphatase
MHGIVNHMVQLDVLALESMQRLRWGPLTAVLVIASAWWVKGPVFVAVGAYRDVSQRRWLPLTAACAALSLALASVLSGLLKGLVDRPRPALTDGAIAPAVPTPDSPSFPSGHTTTAFATAVAVSVLHPRLRVPLLILAGVVGLSRAYLGVHFWVDVAAGALLGTLVGLVAGFAARALLRALQARRAEARA